MRNPVPEAAKHLRKFGNELEDAGLCELADRLEADSSRLESQQRGEALSDLITALDAALARAREALAGFERTHILVPVELSEEVAEIFQDRANGLACRVGSTDPETQRMARFAEAFRDARRRRPSEWPATDTEEGR